MTNTPNQKDIEDKTGNKVVINAETESDPQLPESPIFPDKTPSDTSAPIHKPINKIPPPAPLPPKKSSRNMALLWSFIIILIVAFAAFAYQFNERLVRVGRAVADREQSSNIRIAEVNVKSQQALDTARQLDNQLMTLSTKLADAQNQQQALEQLYQDLAHNRDDWTLAEVDQMLSTASQQLQLTANVRLALFALQNADARLALSEAPQIINVRRAIALDIDQLKEAPITDITGLAIKLDNVIAMVDTLPLRGDLSPPLLQATRQTTEALTSKNESSATLIQSTRSKTALSKVQEKLHTWWNNFAMDAGQLLKNLVQVRQIDGNNANAMLIAPNQANYLKDNVKLRLLSARLALLSRNEKAMKMDLSAADLALAHYFDNSSRRLQQARAVILQVEQSAINMTLPDLENSLKALHQYKTRN